MEHKFSDIFVAYAVQRHNQTQADLVDQLFNSSRKKAGTGPLVTGPIREKSQSQGGDAGCKSGDSGGDDWYNPTTREFLHEQI
jgi:hypothetical protein